MLVTDSRLQWVSSTEAIPIWQLSPAAMMTLQYIADSATFKLVYSWTSKTNCVLLEEQLDHYDTSDHMRSTRKGLTPEQYAPRAKLLGEIETVFASYGACKNSLTFYNSLN